MHALPFRGATQTARNVREGVYESLERKDDAYDARLLAERVCAEVRAKDWLSEALALHYWLCDQVHVRYMRDPRTIELIKYPYVICRQLMQHQKPSVDCDEYAGLETFFQSLIGAETFVAIVAFRHMFAHGERQYQHALAQVREPNSGTILTLDPVAGERTGRMLKRVVAARIYPVTA